MAESLNSKRVFFSRGKQREFLLSSKKELGVTWGALADICEIGTKSLAGWREEKYSMSFFALERICERRDIEMPADAVIKDAYWYTTKGASAGGKAIVEKYGSVGGNPEYRKKKWREWWDREGKFKQSPITQPRPFKKPVFSEALAEFVGILLGDGGISEHQITVTLNRVTDKEYLGFVYKLIEDLFQIPVGSYSDKRSLACRVVISRTALVTYLVDMIGLSRGNKIRQQADIPRWIKENRQYSIACVRGLIDTDGCAILHQYFSKGKKYCYKKVGFTSHSYPLLKSVSDILSTLEIKHRIMKNEWDIRIETKKDVEKYFQVVGTSNPKHLKRYRS
jgi:hypothetical protein